MLGAQRFWCKGGEVDEAVGRVWEELAHGMFRRIPLVMIKKIAQKYFGVFMVNNISRYFCFCSSNIQHF